MVKRKLIASPKLTLKTRGTSELESSVAKDMTAPDGSLCEVNYLKPCDVDPESKKKEEEEQIEAEMNAVDEEVDE